MMRVHGAEGFTLLELLVTVTVIGIVLLVAAPAFPAPMSGGDTAAVRRMLERGAFTAARLGQSVSVGMDVESGSLILGVRDSVLAREALEDAYVRLPSLAKIYFLPDGRAVGGPIVLITSEGATTIQIDRWVGRVSVERSR